MQRRASKISLEIVCRFWADLPEFSDSASYQLFSDPLVRFQKCFDPCDREGCSRLPVFSAMLMENATGKDDQKAGLKNVTRRRLGNSISHKESEKCEVTEVPSRRILRRALGSPLRITRSDLLQQRLLQESAFGRRPSFS